MSPDTSSGDGAFFGRELEGREVPLQGLHAYFEDLERRGLPPERLLAGTDVSLDGLRSSEDRISWSAFLKVMENAEKLWSDEELVALGAATPLSPWFRPFLAVARLRYGPADVYRWIAQPGASIRRMTVSCLTYTFEEIDRDRLVMELRFAPGYDPPRIFLLGAKGALAMVPTLFGRQPAQITTVPTARGARFEIQVPPPPPLLQRLWRALSWPFQSRRVAASLQADFENLNESTRQYAAIFNASTDGIAIHDLEGRILDLNPAVERVLGYTREELLAMDALALVAPGFEPIYLHYFAEIRAGRSVSTEMSALRRDGTLVELETRASPIEFRGRPCGLAVIRDVSQRRRAEREHAELAEQLRQAQKMEAIGQLAGGIAHDFNNLLTVITGYAELLLESAKDAEHLDAAEQIRVAADRGAALTRQLLAFSRGAVSRSEVLNPNALVRDLEKMLGRLIGENIELVLDLDPETGWIDADPSRIEQAVVNLALNARDAMPAGGRLSVETRRVPGGFPAADDGGAAEAWVRIRVTDTGHGMTEGVRQRIFEPFFTTKEIGKGTGLGLAVVFAMVRHAGGHIRVESAPGAGARFDVFFPAAAQPARPAAADERSELLAARPGETILLVEDEPMVREITRASLESRGFRVLEARHGAEALARVTAGLERLDIVVADVVMPEMSGAELARELRAQYSELRVILVSGYAEAPGGGRLPAGVHFLPKPFRQDALLREIRRVLDGDG